jgi:hypothetical protein
MLNKNYRKRGVMILMVMIVVALLFTTTSFAAAETGITLTGAAALSGGDITFSDFGPVTLTGVQQTSTATWSITDVVDGRGTGDGWNLSLTLTQLKEYDTGGSAYVVDGKAIATSSVTVTTAPVVTLADDTSSPTNTITVVSNGTALDTGSPVKLLSAAVDGGMGSYAISDMTSTLAIRADTYAGTYKSDATVALVTGP